MLCSLTDPVGMVTHLGMAKEERNEQNESALLKKKKRQIEKNKKACQNRIRLDSFHKGPSNFPSLAKTNKGILIFITLKLKKKDEKNRLTQKCLSLGKKIFSAVLK